MLFKILIVTLGAALPLSAFTQGPPDCQMALAFEQADEDARGGKTAVWLDAKKSALFFVEKLNVNTDGTSRSYSIDDFWGESVALNNLCNAMNGKCAELKNEMAKRGRRILTQKAAADGWPRGLLEKTRISESIIPFNNGKPCPTVNGFMVSATALHKTEITDNCDSSNYVDALVTPAIVIPKNPKGGVSEFHARGARVGDLVVTMLPGSASPVFAVVGDTGPINSLGEGSLALNGRLLGKKEAPKNYREVRGKAPFNIKDSWVVPPTAVLIFPSTRNLDAPYITPQRIDEATRPIFESWGGVERLSACIKRAGF